MQKMSTQPVLWLDKSDAWVYGGIRSIGKYVAVLDHEKNARELYLAGPSRRKMREWLRKEFGDSVVMVPFDFPK